MATLRLSLSIGFAAPLALGVVLASPHGARASVYDFTYRS